MADSFCQPQEWKCRHHLVYLNAQNYSNMLYGKPHAGLLSSGRKRLHLQKQSKSTLNTYEEQPTRRKKALLKQKAEQ